MERKQSVRIERVHKEREGVVKVAEQGGGGVKRGMGELERKDKGRERWSERREGGLAGGGEGQWGRVYGNAIPSAVPSLGYRSLVSASRQTGGVSLASPAAKLQRYCSQHPVQTGSCTQKASEAIQGQGNMLTC